MRTQRRDSCTARMAIEPYGASSSGPNGYSRGSDAGYDGDDYEHEDEYDNEPIDFSDIEQRWVAEEARMCELRVLT